MSVKAKLMIGTIERIPVNDVDRIHPPFLYRYTLNFNFGRRILSPRCHLLESFDDSID
jgi:hypothetical protein